MWVYSCLLKKFLDDSLTVKHQYMKSLSAAFSVGSPPSKSKFTEHNPTLWPDIGNSNKKRPREEHHTPSITPDKNIKVKFSRPKEVSKFKIFNDPIHDSIKFDSMCLRIIDTVQFKRLRGLKQLGVCDHVRPVGSHHRCIRYPQFTFE